MEAGKNQQSVKASAKLSEKATVRMKKGSVILNVSKHRIDEFKRMGYAEV